MMAANNNSNNSIGIGTSNITSIVSNFSLTNSSSSYGVLTEEVLPPERFWLYLTNLFIYAIEFPVSLFSAFTVLSSAILHPNLKLIILCQNACFFIFAFSRTVQIGMIFAISPTAWQSYKSIQCGILFSTLYGNMIGHILLLERLLATFYVKDYEHKQKLWFPLCWFPLLFTISLVNAYSETYQSSAADASLNITLGTMVSLSLSMALSFAEIFILSMMGVHNRKTYHQQRGQKHGGLTLSERYQLSENIRTSKQLGPTFLFHFANVCCTTLLGICMYFDLVVDIFNLMAIAFWLNSLFNATIEISVIIRHPILRRNANANLAKLIPLACCCLSSISTTAASSKVGPASFATTSDYNMRWAEERGGGGRPRGPRNIDGHQLIHTPRHEDYQRFLANSWKLEEMNPPMRTAGRGGGGTQRGL